MHGGVWTAGGKVDEEGGEHSVGRPPPGSIHKEQEEVSDRASQGASD